MNRLLFPSVAVLVLATSAGCGGSESDPDPEANAMAEIEACAAVPNDLTPAATPTRLDGIWSSLGFSDDGPVHQGCLITLRKYTKPYYQVTNGAYSEYWRVYPTEAACFAAGFDEGGVVEVQETGVWRQCGATFKQGYITFWQTVELARQPDGSVKRTYMFTGRTPQGPDFEQILTGNTFSATPFPVPPQGLKFDNRHRHPL